MTAMTKSGKHRGLVDIRGFSVMKAPCATCPFKTNFLDAEAMDRYTTSLVTFQAQHLCHTVDNKMICRGGRDIMLRAMCALGFIEEATDECFERTSKEVLDERQTTSPRDKEQGHKPKGLPCRGRRRH